MGETIDGTEYTNWFSHLFPSPEYHRVGLVAAGVSVGLLAVGFVVAAVGNIQYRAGIFLGAFACFWMLAALGLAEDRYVDVWNDVRGAFAVDDDAYREVVDTHLERVHDGRRVLGYTAVLVVPYFLVVAATYLPEAPFHDLAVAVIYGGNTTYPPGVPTVVLVYLFGLVNGLLLGTILNGFVNHLLLVSEVSDLPFRNVHTAASELEPIAGFSMASATAWFAGVSLVVLWIHVGISVESGVSIVAALAFAGLVFFVAPQLLLHDALSDAKRAALAEIRAEYAEMHRLAQSADEPADGLSLQLEVTDRRLENAKAISTWVYHLRGMGKLVAAAVLPWLTLVQELVSTGRLLS